VSPLPETALLIEAGGSAALAGHALLAGLALLRRAQLLLADGAVLALSLKTGAALLKTMELGSADAILRFLAILALRIALKQAFSRERAWLLRGG
jgi:hypothetical protein